MEPVAKIAWVGETERTIESYSSWSLGRFIRKPKKHTKKELMKIYYEIELDIEFHESINVIAARYKELDEADKSFASAAKSAHSGHQTNFYGHDYPSMREGYESAWDKRKREEKEKDDAEKVDRLGNHDFTKKVGQTITLSSGEDGVANLVTQLERFKKLDSAFAVILTQDPKTKLGFLGALTEAMEEVKNSVLALRDIDETDELTEEEVGQEASFMEQYNEEAENYALELINNGDDMLAEYINEFYIEPAEYYPVLQKMYDFLSKQTKTILGEHLKQSIIVLTIDDDSVDTAPEQVTEGQS